MKLSLQNHSFSTEGCGQFIDVTGDVEEAVRESGVNNGVAVVYSPHTTCGIVINEQESGFIEDFNSLMDALVPRDGSYLHDDPNHRTENLEDPHDTPNGHAHCRHALLASSSQMIPIADGELMLGRWQRIFFLELDRARDRRVLIQTMGDG